MTVPARPAGSQHLTFEPRLVGALAAALTESDVGMAFMRNCLEGDPPVAFATQVGRAAARQIEAASATPKT
jgi:hypothetical protein